MRVIVLRGQASDRMKVELAKAGFITDSIDDIAASAMTRIAFGDDGTIRVTTADGKPMIGSGADHGATLNDLAKDLAVTKKWALLDGGLAAAGSQPEAAAGSPERKRSHGRISTQCPQRNALALDKVAGKLWSLKRH